VSVLVILGVWHLANRCSDTGSQTVRTGRGNEEGSESWTGRSVNQGGHLAYLLRASEPFLGEGDGIAEM
jgi:hypothetical protein